MSALEQVALTTRAKTGSVTQETPKTDLTEFVKALQEYNTELSKNSPLVRLKNAYVYLKNKDSFKDFVKYGIAAIASIALLIIVAATASPFVVNIAVSALIIPVFVTTLVSLGMLYFARREYRKASRPALEKLLEEKPLVLPRVLKILEEQKS